MYYLTAEASFDSAHFLFGHQGKCSNLHGHRWRIIAKIAGETLQDSADKSGMLIDFSDFKRELHALADSLDHALLMERGTLRLETMDALEAEGFEIIPLSFRPTAENLAKYLYDCMKELSFPIQSMTVYETPDNCAAYEGSEP